MFHRNCIKTWLDACRELKGYADIPGYRQLSWFERKRLDLLIIWPAILSERFWRAAIFVLITSLIANIVCWKLDLTAWQRDLLRSLPVILTAPWIAACRKHHLRKILDARNEKRLDII